MSLAAATSAQRLELLAQLTNLGKELYAIETQPLDVNTVGAAFDTKLLDLEAAIDAVQAAA